jgi:hypothetical protein
MPIGAGAPGLSHQGEPETPSTYPPPYLIDDERTFQRHAALKQKAP